MEDKFVLWKQNLATKIGKKSKILISIYKDVLYVVRIFFCKYKHSAYKYHLWFWNFKFEKIPRFNKLLKKNNAQNGDEINLVYSNSSCSSFSDLSVKCCSTSVEAGKNESIERFEKRAGSFSQDPAGLSYVTSSWSVKLLKRSEKRQVFFHPEAYDPQLHLSFSSSPEISIWDTGIMA